MSEVESRFDVWRMRIGLFGAPATALVVWLGSDGGPAGKLAALFAATAILWISEAIPPAVTALVAVALSVVLGIASAKEAFAALGNPILFLFVGSFMVAEAMSVHGLGARFARATARHARGRLGSLCATSGATFLMSMWMSNAAATAVVLPIALQIARATKDRRYAAAMVLAIAWGASMGGLCTPVGTPPNLIGMRAAQELPESAGLAAFGFVDWMKVATPPALVMLVAMWVVLALVFRIRPGDAPPPVDVAARPWTRGEVAALCAFVLAASVWTLPGVLDALGVGVAKELKQRLPEEVVALLAAALLFLWPINRRGEPPRRALSWREAAGIDWGTVLLFGGGILLGDLANKTGLAKAWGEALMSATGASSTWAVVALVTCAALILSELASNTAAATLMVPVAISLAQATGTPVLAALLGATLGASFGFMMPISTAPNAMAYATGEVSVRQMVVAGLLFDVVGFVVVLVSVLVLVPLLAP